MLLANDHGKVMEGTRIFFSKTDLIGHPRIILCDMTI